MKIMQEKHKRWGRVMGWIWLCRNSPRTFHCHCCVHVYV